MIQFRYTQIADKIGDVLDQNEAREGLTQAYVFAGDLISARVDIESSRQYDHPKNHRNVLKPRILV
jgi:hypothetical protein